MQRNRFLLGAAAVCSLLMAALPARADVQYQFSISPLTQTVSAGGIGSFDVNLTNLTSAAVNIGGFSFHLATQAGSPIVFTDATDATTLPYIFDGNSLFGPDIVTSSVPTTDIQASDFAAAPNSYFTLGAGQSIGLGNVTFTVSPTAQPLDVGLITFQNYAFPGLTTSLSDALGNSLPVSVANGQVTVPEADSVATLVFMQLALLAAFALRSAVRRRG